MSALLKSIPDDWGPNYKGEAGAVARTRTGPNAIRVHHALPIHIAHRKRCIGPNDLNHRRGELDHGRQREGHEAAITANRQRTTTLDGHYGYQADQTASHRCWVR
jgi:hypothetical protein